MLMGMVQPSLVLDAERYDDIALGERFVLPSETWAWLGAGFILININVRAESENFRGEFGSRIKGVVGHIKIYL